VDLGAPELIIVLVIALVLFGGSQIPKLARNLGRAQKEFQDGIQDAKRSEPSSDDNPAGTEPGPTKETSPTA
jgi:sec-independent protein translocase protein TatA